MSTLKADTIQNTSGGAATLTKQSAAKAYFHASSTATIVDSQSFNISSGTDNGTGDWQYAITNAMSSADYIGVATANTGGPRICSHYANNNTASVFAILLGLATDGSLNDQPHNGVAHGDLA